MGATITDQIAEATAAVDAARQAFETASTQKARRDAAEDLEFWTSKRAFLTAVRPERNWTAADVTEGNALLESM